MQILNGIMYAAMFAGTAYFLLTVHTISQASSFKTKAFIMYAFLLLVAIPMTSGFLSGLLQPNPTSTLGYVLGYGSMASSSIGLYLLARGLKSAVIDAYAGRSEAIK
ncbi:MAG: hypothetical protein ACQES2_09625 [Pseudomonadota bacterium]